MTIDLTDNSQLYKQITENDWINNIRTQEDSIIQACQSNYYM